MATKKLFWYYLKKLLWRSWRVWIIILFSWVWWALLTWGLASGAQGFVSSRLPEKVKEELKKNALWKTVHNSLYQGVLLADVNALKWVEESTPENLGVTPEVHNVLKAIAFNFKETIETGAVGSTYEEREKFFRKKYDEEGSFFTAFDIKYEVDKESQAEQWRRRYSSLGTVGLIQIPLRTPYDFPLVEFAAQNNKKLSTWDLVKVTHTISLWNFGGFMVCGFFVYTLLDKLFFDTKKDGEDVMIINFTPSLTRVQLFLSKVLAYATTLAIFVLLGCALPYGILLGFSHGLALFPWGAFLWLTFYTTVIGAICFTLLPAAFYLMLNTLGVFGRVLQYLLSYLPLLYFFSFFNTGISKIFAYVEYWYWNPAVHLGLAVLLGSLLLWIYYSYYKQEDLS